MRVSDVSMAAPGRMFRRWRRLPEWDSALRNERCGDGFELESLLEEALKPLLQFCVEIGPIGVPSMIFVFASSGGASEIECAAFTSS